MARFSAFIVARGFRFPPRSTVTANRSSRHCQGFISICHSLCGEAKARRIDGHPCSRAGMFYARHFEVIGVKRLIDNDRIASIAPRAHHGRRDISRTRPHSDADGLSHPQRFSRYERLDQRKWTSLVLTRLREQRLALRENANQRTARWRLGAKIANKSSLGPDLHMTGRALGAVDQYRSHRRFVRI